MVEGRRLLKRHYTRIVLSQWLYGVAVLCYKCLKVSRTWTHNSCPGSGTVIKMCVKKKVGDRAWKVVMAFWLENCSTCGGVCPTGHHLIDLIRCIC